MADLIYRRTVITGQRLHVRRLRAVTTPAQGLHLKLASGRLFWHAIERFDDATGGMAKGLRVPEIILWGDSPEVDLVCELETADTELKVWNCWEDPRGPSGLNAWTGDAGMIVEANGNRTLFRCSAGYHAFSPTDLEVEIEFS